MLFLCKFTYHHLFQMHKCCSWFPLKYLFYFDYDFINLGWPWNLGFVRIKVDSSRSLFQSWTSLWRRRTKRGRSRDLIFPTKSQSFRCSVAGSTLLTIFATWLCSLKLWKKTLSFWMIASLALQPFVPILRIVNKVLLKYMKMSFLSSYNGRRK